MVTEPCREWRAELGAEALGRPTGPERLALRAHLDGCPACRSELRALEPVANALSLADVDRLAEAPESPAGLADRVVGRIAAERARGMRRRRRLLLAAAAVVAAIVVPLGAILMLSGGGGGHVVTFSVRPPGVEAQAVLHEGEVGTYVDLEYRGLDPSETYWLWLTGADGVRVAAGSFRGGRDRAEVSLTAAIPLGKTRRVWVTDANDGIVLDAWLPPA